MVYPNKNAPEMVYLFEKKELDSLFASISEDNTSVLYVTRGLKPLENGLDQRLYNLIWKTLQTHLKGIKKLYISPYGQLNKINLAAIPVNDNKRMSDLFEMEFVSTARNFVLPQEKEYPNTAVVMGGLNYDNSVVIVDTAETRGYDLSPNFEILDFGTLMYNEEPSWKFLNGTKIEARTIANQLNDKGFTTQFFTDRQGTEQIIKQSDGTKSSPRVLHIATHGFFFPNAKEKLDDETFEMLGKHQSSYRFSEDPLIRTGLILAGANPAWQGDYPKEGQEDNILTAYEIANLDLSDTELVVLSACKTGLGDIQGNEGVYGLQRGFKLAGVKYLIVSLWDVPDTETQEMMVLFYEKWLEEGMSIPDAFRAAQKEMRDKYEDEPYKWAGFILVE